MIYILRFVWDLGEIYLICDLIKLSLIFSLRYVKIEEVMDNLMGTNYFLLIL
jgi:hypothetical protein